MAASFYTDAQKTILFSYQHLLMGSDPNVVNLSPKALIFQGYRALFFFKKFLIFFLKKT
jgi:hypothetical protein